MNISCDIIRDILPLYAEDMVSDATKEMVEAHIDACDGCAKELETLRKGSVAVEAGARALNRVKHGIRRRRLLAVLAVFFFLATLLSGGALLLDAPVHLSAEEAVEEIWVEGNTVKIRWDDRIIAVSARTETEDPGNYAVTAWTNLMNILMPPQRIPYEALDEEVQKLMPREQYEAMDSVSSYELSGQGETNFWYYDLSGGDVTLLLDGNQPYPETELMRDENRIRAYVYAMWILCAVTAAAGWLFRKKWYGQLLLRAAIVTGSCALSAITVTAGQLVDIYGKFTEMLVDSTVVVVPMALCGLSVLELVKLNRQDRGL